MTVIYCDLCGIALDKGNSGVRILISEFKVDSRDKCAKELINHIKDKEPYKSGHKK